MLHTCAWHSSVWNLLSLCFNHLYPMPYEQAGCHTICEVSGVHDAASYAPCDMVSGACSFMLPACTQAALVSAVVGLCNIVSRSTDGALSDIIIAHASTLDRSFTLYVLFATRHSCRSHIGCTDVSRFGLCNIVS